MKVKSIDNMERVRLVLGRILVTLGILLVILPVLYRVVNIYFMADKTHNIQGIIDHVEIVDEATIDPLLLDMKEFNENLYKNGQEVYDPFSLERIDFNLVKYGYTDNMIGKITIPKINVELPIYLGATEANLQQGAAHLSQTSLPTGDINSNVVIAAHRGLIKHPMFDGIVKLVEGDEVIITNFWEDLKYKVESIEIIDPDDSGKILIQDGKDMVTLVTCHPYRVNTHRYVVYCVRAEE